MASQPMEVAPSSLAPSAEQQNLVNLHQLLETQLVSGLWVVEKLAEIYTHTHTHTHTQGENSLENAFHG